MNYQLESTLKGDEYVKPFVDGDVDMSNDMLAEIILFLDEWGVNFDDQEHATLEAIYKYAFLPEYQDQVEVDDVVAPSYDDFARAWNGGYITQTPVRQ